jgi:hypothetical protein
MNDGNKYESLRGLPCPCMEALAQSDAVVRFEQCIAHILRSTWRSTLIPAIVHWSGFGLLSLPQCVSLGAVNTSARAQLVACCCWQLE